MQTTQAPASVPADPGFKIPSDAPAPARPAAEPGAQPGMEVAAAPDAPKADTSTRDLAIGATVFVVLLLVYFFARSAFVQHLVVRRVAPSAAGSAGWLLFLGLSFLSAAAVLAMINTKYLAFAITAPLVVVGLVALVAAMFVGRR
jgi:hypothetical protein